MKKLLLIALLCCLMPFCASAETTITCDVNGQPAAQAALIEKQLSVLSSDKKVLIENSFLTGVERAKLRKQFPDLTLSFCDTLEGVRVKENDERVDFAGVTAIDPALLRRLIAAHPTLKAIDLYDAHMKTSDQLALFDEYPGIEFGFTIRFAEHVVRSDVTAFSTLHSKRSEPHTSQQLSALRMCRHLRALDIGHNIADDISWLRSLPELRILIIALNRIEDISPLSSLTHLEYLEMFNNYIKDISPLLNCKELLDLNIGFNCIGDISPLYELPKLERLWMYSFRVRNADSTTPEMRQTLRERLPHCTFEFTHYPTLEGWREHPRYFTMYDIFQTRVYRPWDAQPPTTEEKQK